MLEGSLACVGDKVGGAAPQRQGAVSDSLELLAMCRAAEIASIRLRVRAVAVAVGDQTGERAISARGGVAPARLRGRSIPDFRQARVSACGDHGFVGLTKGGTALFDAADLRVVHGRRWFIAGGGYAAASIDGRNVTMHRAILAADSEHTDHINHDRADNRRANIRPCSAAENLRNRRKHRVAGGMSPFKGVSAAGGRFNATVTANRKVHYCGSYSTAEEAARAYDHAVLKLHGEFACTNVSLGLLPPLPDGELGYCRKQRGTTAAAKVSPPSRRKAQRPPAAMPLERRIERYSEVIALRNQGLTFGQIGKRVGLTRERCFSIVKQHHGGC
jgi:hypothetical protein